MKLTDESLEAQFIHDVDGKCFRVTDEIVGSQGLLIYCPCGGGHCIMIPFANPFNAPKLPPDFGPLSRDGTSHPRWNVSGDSLENLTLTPSVDVGITSCWHGFITNGEIR